LKRGTTIGVLELGFDVYNPLVTEAVQRAVFDFCETTLRTAFLDAEQAYLALKVDLREGLEGGETNRELARRVQSIFGDQSRAARIAVTEASRAVHAGGQQLARETGIVSGKKWLASGDACPACLEMAAMGTVPLDEPYTTRRTGSPAYRVVMAPPLHPHCMCTETHELDYAAVNAGEFEPDVLQIGARRNPLRRAREMEGVSLAASWVPPWLK
jgi:hypothetical protein